MGLVHIQFFVKYPEVVPNIDWARPVFLKVVESHSKCLEKNMNVS